MPGFPSALWPYGVQSRVSSATQSRGYICRSDRGADGRSEYTGNIFCVLYGELFKAYRGLDPKRTCNGQ